MTEETPIRRPPVRRFLDAQLASLSPDGDRFRPLEPEIRIIQFGQALSEDELIRAGRLIASRPDVWLRAHPGRSPDLKFLRFFPGLRHLDLDIYELDSLDGLAHAAGGLQSFHFGQTRKSFPLAFLTDLPELRSLYLGGHKKGVEVLSRLVGLTELTLRGVTLPDLSLLLPLTRLRGLALLLGGTRDLGLLPRFPVLDELSLLRITGLSDLSMLAEVERLKTLSLAWMPNVTSLPSFAPLPALESVSMETMKGVTSLAPIAAAPALSRLEIINMRQLDAASFACLLGHPSLQTLLAFPGSNRVHAEIQRMFPGVAR